MRGKILVVEDDSLMTDMVSRYLERDGYKVYRAYCGKEALELFERIKPDVVVLDLMLPDIDGFELCKSFSEGSSMILILSVKDADEDKIVGLELGADDYMSKPFNMRELMARIKALIRRKNKLEGKRSGTLNFGNLELNLGEMRAYVKGKPLELTPKEFLILKKLVENKGCVVSRSSIAHEIYPHEPPEYERIIDTYIYRLRTKIMELDRETSERIKTVRGFGYKVE